jgi:amino acid transporter
MAIKDVFSKSEKPPVRTSEDVAHDVGSDEEMVSGLHRRLSNRQIQWIAIGGSIGTALFVSIAWGLVYV